MAKLKNYGVFSGGYRCYENPRFSCRFGFSSGVSTKTVVGPCRHAIPAYKLRLLVVGESRFYYKQMSIAEWLDV